MPKPIFTAYRLYRLNASLSVANFCPTFGVIIAGSAYSSGGSLLASTSSNTTLQSNNYTLTPILKNNKIQYILLTTTYILQKNIPVSLLKKNEVYGII
jgi:hypothetical protein